MRGRLRKQLAKHIRAARGNQTLEEFSRRLGISTSTLQRIEIGEQNVTLDTLERMEDRLKLRIQDLFAEL